MSNEEITLIITAIAAITGSAFSIIFTFFPGLNTWFAAQTTEFKQAIMSISGFVAALIIVIVKNAGAEVNWSNLLVQFFIAWIAYTSTNQSTHKIVPKPGAVKAAKSGAGGAG